MSHGHNSEIPKRHTKELLLIPVIVYCIILMYVIYILKVK